MESLLEWEGTKEGSKPLLSSVCLSRVLYIRSVYPWIYDNRNTIGNFQSYGQKFVIFFSFVFVNYQEKILF